MYDIIFSYEFLGTLGFGLIECSYLPQIIRLHRIKEAEDFSYLFPSINFLGRVLVLLYSLQVEDNVVAVGVIFGLAIRATLMGQVFYYRRMGRRKFEVVKDGSGI